MKLKLLTKNIKLSQDKSTPVRQTKLAYVDSVAKPPRNVARSQVCTHILRNINQVSVEYSGAHHFRPGLSS